MEYLMVKFSQTRGVLVDGNQSGRTNVVTEIESGTHTISLNPPPNFAPQEIEVVLEPNQTSPLSPKEISFAAV